MSHYLVTGVAGFIAARVAEMLLDEGHFVHGVDNLNDAYDVRMKEYRLSKLADRDRFKFTRGDITEKAAMEELFKLANTRSMGRGFEAVINLAARAGVRQSVENPWVYIETNIQGTLNLLELSKAYGVSKFILASTSSVYGDNAPLPTPEDASSDHPLQPYAASKKGAEVLCHAYHYLYGIDVTVFRYFTVYGPAARPDMVMFRLAQWISEDRVVRINGDGEQTRGFTYIDDIARGIIQGLLPLGYQVINLGGHETISINDLVKLFEELIGKPARIEYQRMHPADMQANWADVEKARQLLGWEPTIGLREGITRLVAWYQAERNWASQIRTE